MSINLLNSSYSIRDVIYELEILAKQFGGDTPVVVSSDYGDHCHTEKLNAISEVTADLPVRTAYSDSGYAFGGNIDNDDNENIVIVLRGI